LISIFPLKISGIIFILQIISADEEKTLWMRLRLKDLRILLCLSAQDSDHMNQMPEQVSNSTFRPRVLFMYWL